MIFGPELDRLIHPSGNIDIYTPLHLDASQHYLPGYTCNRSYCDLLITSTMPAVTALTPRDRAKSSSTKTSVSPAPSSASTTASSELSELPTDSPRSLLLSSPSEVRHKKAADLADVRYSTTSWSPRRRKISLLSLPWQRPVAV